MLILAAYDRHDASAAVAEDYDLLAAVALERLTRVKSDGYRFPNEAVDECLSISGARRADVDVVCLPRTKFDPRYFFQKLPDRLGLSFLRSHELIREMAFWGVADPHRLFDAKSWLADHGFNSKAQVSFYNHHFSHALAALFHMQHDNAVTFTADGYGDRVYYSLYRLADGHIKALIGGEGESLGRRKIQTRESSLGRFYHDATAFLGFTPNRHEGKVLGLAAFGSPTLYPAMRKLFRVTEEGRIEATARRDAIRKLLKRAAKEEKREDVAASVQAVLEDVVLEAVGRVVARLQPKALGLAGGVLSNVKLNQRLAERFAFEEVFVYPAMTDQGEPAGGILQFLLERDGEARWLARRRRLGDVYLGRDYRAFADAAFCEGAVCLAATARPAETCAGLLADGAIVGTFLGRMEYGPRALGNRSILAAATDRSINDWLNKRLSRTEFMPFAPVVRDARASDVFRLGENLRYAAAFMTVTCDVREEWKDRIPAVVHVDGTARPQIVSRDQNPVYYDILASYERLTGIPALINTSFNVHEEPIINSPSDCLKALKDGRVDYVVTEGGVWSAGPKS